MAFTTAFLFVTILWLFSRVSSTIQLPPVKFKRYCGFQPCDPHRSPPPPPVSFPWYLQPCRRQRGIRPSRCRACEREGAKPTFCRRHLDPYIPPLGAPEPAPSRRRKAPAPAPRAYAPALTPQKNAPAPAPRTNAPAPAPRKVEPTPAPPVPPLSPPPPDEDKDKQADEVVKKLIAGLGSGAIIAGGLVGDEEVAKDGAGLAAFKALKKVFDQYCDIKDMIP